MLQARAIKTVGTNKGFRLITLAVLPREGELLSLSDAKGDTYTVTRVRHFPVGVHHEFSGTGVVVELYLAQYPPALDEGLNPSKQP